MSDIAAIAGKLSEGQRAALTNGTCSVPRRSDEWSSDCICGATAASVELVDMGLAYLRGRFPGGIVLNEAGLQLRDHLISKEPR